MQKILKNLFLALKYNKKKIFIKKTKKNMYIILFLTKLHLIKNFKKANNSLIINLNFIKNKNLTLKIIKDANV